jgi:hypothetical protein
MGRGEGIGMATIDPAWWTSGSYQTQPMSEILASRDFGKVFAFLRQRGWSVGALSAATQIDEYPIREIIKGNRRVSAYEVIERIVVGLSIERHVCGVGVAPPVTIEVPAERRGLVELEDWLAHAGAVDDQAIYTLAERRRYLVVAPPAASSDDPRRRTGRLAHPPDAPT